MDLQKELILLFIDANLKSIKRCGGHKSIIQKTKYTTKDGIDKITYQHLTYLWNINELTDEQLENVFWMPNYGKTTFKYSSLQKKMVTQEGRKAGDIVNVHFFYQDFDLKDENGKSYDDIIIKEKKRELLKKIKQLPLEPDYIVESRNGYHIYYTIPRNRWGMRIDFWKHIERCMYDYIKRNISPYVDPQATNPNRILRLPNSWHKKTGSELFPVQILIVRNFQKRIELLANDNYIGGTACYDIKEIIKAFHIPRPDNSTLNTSIKKEININDATSIVNENSNSINTSKEDIFLGKYPIIDAFHDKNTQSELFLKLREKYSHSTPVTRAEARKIVESIDMREILGIDAEINKAVSSLFYKDVHPSDTFYIDNNKVKYYCRRENRWYNNIFNIIARVQYGPITLKTTEYKAVFDYVYNLFGFKIINGFDAARETNLSILKNVQNVSKKTKWFKRIILVYGVILDLWKSHSDKNNTPWKSTYMDIASPFLADICRNDYGLKITQPDAKRILLILETLRIIRRVEGNYIGQNEKVVSRYMFEILQYSDVDRLTKRVEKLKDDFDQPIKYISQRKLDTLCKNT